MDAAAREAGQPAGADRRARPLGPRPQDRDRHGRAAAAAGRRRRDAGSPAASAAAWRSAGCCSSSPTCCCSTSRPTTSTPRASAGSSATCAEFPGTVVAVTHDRYFLDNVAGWILELDRGAGHSLGGQLLLLAGAEAAAAGPGGEAGLGPAEDAAARARVGAHGARARGRPRARRASPATRSCARRPSGRPRAAPRS